jgi:hypothetical protein
LSISKKGLRQIGKVNTTTSENSRVDTDTLVKLQKVINDPIIDDEEIDVQTSYIIL